MNLIEYNRTRIDLILIMGLSSLNTQKNWAITYSYCPIEILQKNSTGEI